MGNGKTLVYGKGVLLFSIILLVLSFSTVSKAEEIYGEEAYRYMEFIQNTFPERVINSQQLEDTKAWLISEITKMGYDIDLEHFKWIHSDKNYYEGDNIIFKKTGVSTKEIVIGAHYDSVNTPGADDNASGVGLLLETAKRIFLKRDIPYTIRFILFSGEEPGCFGSLYHVSQASTAYLNNIVCMINLDTIGAGDFMYLYGGGINDTNNEVVRTWAVEQAMDTAITLELPMLYHPDVNEQYPMPIKHTASDHMAFDQIGVPYIYFEASNWNGGNYTNFYQTSDSNIPDGKMMHQKEYDNLNFYNQMFPGRVEKHLYSYSKLLSTLIDNFVEGSNNSSIVSSKSDVSVADETLGDIVDVQNSNGRLSVGIILLVVAGIGITTLMANYFRDMK